MLDCPMHASQHNHATVHVILGNVRSSNIKRTGFAERKSHPRRKCSRGLVPHEATPRLHGNCGHQRQKASPSTTYPSPLHLVIQVPRDNLTSQVHVSTLLQAFEGCCAPNADFPVAAWAWKVQQPTEALRAPDTLEHPR